MSYDAPPTIPTSLQIYNSYVEDPIWQGRFTAIWCSCLGAVIIILLPSLVHRLRQGHASDGVVWCKVLKRGVFVPTAYPAVTLVCILKDAPLISNPNRAGFLACTQFLIVFLFATKNSLLSFLLGPGHGYEKLKFLHRMAGRLMFLSTAIHGSLWICNHVHVFAFVACFVRAYFPHLHMFLRLLRYRFKDATMIAPDESMTLVCVHDCDAGWVASQHICLRVFFSGRILENHPLSILSAPPAYSCLSNPGLLLGARVNGDWTRALNMFVRGEQERLAATDETSNDGDVSAPLQVMIDEPYGGSSVDLGQYEMVLLVSGGSGITFTLGCWTISWDGNIPWFAPMLTDCHQHGCQLN
ncbi:hypothetical protein HD554DRAFT_2040945 [Boletus coccyginus]|nr:hypothetical protein HD554DRAFT_2040945 [Boletus coccyginus]